MTRFASKSLPLAAALLITLLGMQQVTGTPLPGPAPARLLA